MWLSLVLRTSRAVGPEVVAPAPLLGILSTNVNSTLGNANANTLPHVGAVTALAYGRVFFFATPEIEQ